MTDDNATSLVIDTMQLIAMDNPAAALDLLNATDIPHADVLDGALECMALVFAGEDAAARFAELRSHVINMASKRAYRDDDVTAALESIGAAEALGLGDRDRADIITAGSDVPHWVLAWNAIALTGQCVASWLAKERFTEFFSELRRQYGLQFGGAA